MGTGARVGFLAAAALAAACTAPNPYWHGNQRDGGGPGEGGPGDDGIAVMDFGHPSHDIFKWDIGGGDGAACTPGAFLHCLGATRLLRCSPGGTGTVIEDCAPFQCNAAARRCNECDPAKAPHCDGDKVVTCRPNGTKQVSPCPDQCKDGKCVGGCTKKPLYRDKDKDGFGDPKDVVQACPPVPGRVENGDDCDDDVSAVNPQQTSFFTKQTHYWYGGYDYNCDGKEEPKYTQQAACKKQGGSCVGDGWGYGVPGCGKASAWVTCVKTSSGSHPCAKSYTYGTQSCR